MSYEHGYNQVMQAAGLEKIALVGSLAGKATGVARKMKGSFGDMAKLPREIKNWGGTHRMANKFDDAAQAAGMGKRVGGNRATQARQWANQNLKSRARGAAPAIGVTGAAVGGGAYAAGPADTPQNKMKQMSNRHLGTNFKQQSRFSNWTS